MKRFVAVSPPFVVGSHPGLMELSRYSFDRFREIAHVLDPFEAEFAGGPEVVMHNLSFVPERVEAVRADAGGVVYVTARTAKTLTLEATVNGTYRVRVS